MPLQLISGGGDPVTLDEARNHLRLDHSLDDLTVGACIAAARTWAELVCWRGFVTQTWELVLPCFPDDGLKAVERQGIELPMGNLNSVASVKYIDPEGVEQTLAASEYSVDTVTVPGRVRRAYGKSWPSHRSQWDAVRIRYAVGWAVGAVPTPIKQAVLLLVSQLYEHRTPEISGTIISKVGFAVESLLAPYRLVSF